MSLMRLPKVRTRIDDEKELDRMARRPGERLLLRHVLRCTDESFIKVSIDPVWGIIGAVSRVTEINEATQFENPSPELLRIIKKVSGLETRPVNLEVTYRVF